MKKINKTVLVTIVAVLAVVILGSMYWGRCPSVDPLDHTVLMPHEDNCEAFYLCSNGVNILQKCPDGLHFNPRLNVCDWPQNAGCIPGKGFFGDDIYYDLLYTDFGTPPPGGTITPGPATPVRLFNAYTWRHTDVFLKETNLFTGISEDPTKIGTCSWLYNKPDSAPTATCDIK